MLHLNGISYALLQALLEKLHASVMLMLRWAVRGASSNHEDVLLVRSAGAEGNEQEGGGKLE